MRKRRRRKEGTGKGYHTLLWIFIAILWLYMLVNIFPSIGKVTSCLIKETRELNREKSQKAKIEKTLKRTEETLNSLKQGKGWEQKLREKEYVKQGEILIKVEGKLQEPGKKKVNFLQRIIDWLRKGQKESQ